MHRNLATVAIALGLLSVLGLCGILAHIPGYVAFPVGALAVIFFPAAALGVLAPSALASFSISEAVALAFGLGVTILTLAGFIGLAFQARLSHLMYALAMVYAVGTAGVAVKLLRPRMPVAEGSQRTPDRAPRARATLAILLVLGIACALITLVTPRDVDDWYYLAYIRDFASDHALRAEDAIIDAGHPASPRIWYAGWWVAEAMLARLSGADPIPAHQIYIPFLLAPGVVFAVFMLARQIFRSDGAAVLAAWLQALFYLSSAYPFNSTGWMVFCRTSQDKTVACFLMVPIAVALALRSFEGRGRFALYAGLLLGACLVHPLSFVWAGIAIVPFALIETFVSRSKKMAAPESEMTPLAAPPASPPARPVLRLASLLAPLVVLGILLASGMGDVSSELETKAARQAAQLGASQPQGPGTQGPGAQGPEAPEPEAPGSRRPLGQRMFRQGPQEEQGRQGPAQPRPSTAGGPHSQSLYLPGERFPWGYEESDLMTAIRRDGRQIAANPLYVLRFPLALLGLALTVALAFYVRRETAARFLFVTTVAVLLFAFVPPVASLSARFLTWKLVYRLAWVLPWGLVAAFFISRARPRPLLGWIILVAVALALARGNPANYMKSLRGWGLMLRPAHEASDVLEVLAREPSPQGVVIASSGMSRMIPAFAADAYPAFYRGLGTLSQGDIDALMRSPDVTEEVDRTIRKAGARYLLLENTLPLNADLERGEPGFALAHENGQYSLWKVLR